MSKVDRKLRPIYDSLDSRNYKIAIKQCNALLNKHPHSAIVKVLKAVALERSDKKDEALQLCDEVKAMQPTDDAVLNTMLVVYKCTGKLDHATETFETAWNLLPESEDLGNGVFHCYVRELNYAKQQQTAMKLYKKFEKESYLFWVVESLVLQTKGQGPSRLLELAEMLLTKAVRPEKKISSQVLVTYINILKQQQKYQQITELLTLYGDAFHVPSDRLKQMAETRMAMKQWSSAMSLYQQLLEEYVRDDMVFYRGYFDAVFSLFEEHRVDWTSLNVSDIDNHANSFNSEPIQQLNRQLSELTVNNSNPARLLGYSLHLMIKWSMAEKEDKRNARRGPFIGHMEFIKRLIIRGCVFDPIEHGGLIPLLIQYFDLFGERSAFFSDIRPYLLLLPESKRRSLCDTLMSTNLARNMHDNFRNKTSMLRRDLSLHKLQKFSGQYSLRRLDAASRLFDDYVHSLALDKEREITERKSGDELALLAAHLLLEESHATGNNQFLVEACLVLEYGLTQSPHNFQFKLLISKIYALLGSFYPSWQWFTSMSIKHIQLETLSYLALPHAIECCHFEEASHICRELLRFHEEHDRDMPDMIIQSFKHLSLLKVGEMVDFLEKMRKAHFRAVSAVELWHLTLLSKDMSLGELFTFLEENRTEISRLSDQPEWVSTLHQHQDRNALDCWDPVDDSPIKSLTNSTPEDSPPRLQLKALVVRMLADSIERDQLDELQRGLAEMRTLLELVGVVDMSTVSAVEVSSDYQPPVLPFEDFYWRFAFLMFETAYRIGRTVQIVQTQAVNDSEEAKREAAEALEESDRVYGWSHVHRLLNVLTYMMKEMAGQAVMVDATAEPASKSTQNQFVVTRESLRKLSSFLIGPVSWMCLLLQVWTKAIPAAKKHKAAEASIESPLVSVRAALKTLLTSVSQSLTQVIEHVKTGVNPNCNLAVPLKDDDIHVAHFKKPENYSTVLDVTSRLQNGYRTSLNRVMDMAQKRTLTVRNISFKL
eukprot:GILK01005104.1.p1 GENE.GILK01005104.1~~GILK01005104.1.p1  ORF type:complete len:1013 (-),score=216.95 GILK01005104.1:144-3125(-)